MINTRPFDNVLEINAKWYELWIHFEFSFENSLVVLFMKDILLKMISPECNREPKIEYNQLNNIIDVPNRMLVFYCILTLMLRGFCLDLFFRCFLIYESSKKIPKVTADTH
jgi:hypothetical protein